MGYVFTPLKWMLNEGQFIHSMCQPYHAIHTLVEVFISIRWILSKSYVPITNLLTP